MSRSSKSCYLWRRCATADIVPAITLYMFIVHTSCDILDCCRSYRTKYSLVC